MTTFLGLHVYDHVLFTKEVQVIGRLEKLRFQEIRTTPYYVHVLDFIVQCSNSWYLQNVNSQKYLQLCQVKRTPVEYINELIIRNLNSLVNFKNALILLKIEVPINVRIRI